MKRSERTRGQDDVRVAHHGVPPAKLSAAIGAVARPWIEYLGANPPWPAVEFACQTCGAVWNVSRLEDPVAREEEMRHLRNAVVSSAPRGTEAEVRQLFDMLYERAVAAFPEDRRMVVNLAVVNLGGGSFRVDVASMSGGDAA